MMKQIFYTAIFIYFTVTPNISVFAAATKTIGTECKSDTECISNQCEGSKKTDTNGNQLSYCACGELDLSVATPDDSQDCADFYGGTKNDWTCKDGADMTWDLNYCLNNIDSIKSKFPLPPTDPSFVDHLLDSSAVIATTYNEIQNIIGKPQPKITIPGVSFTEGKTIEEDDGIFLYIPFLGEYIAAIYKYGVVMASIIAVIMIIFSGFNWAISGGESEKINKAKTRIGQSIIGLLLAVSSYVILYTTNPELVSFKSLRVRYVAGVALNDTEQFLATFGSEGHDSGTIETITDGIPGSWRNNAFSTSVCDDKQGLNLSAAERKKRLINIIKNWKNIAADQGGAIYVHGGGIDCSYSNPSSPFVLNQMISLYINKKNEFSLGFFDTECGKLLELLVKVDPNLLSTKNKERMEAIKKLIVVPTEEDIKKEKDPQKKQELIDMQTNNPKRLELVSKCNEFKVKKEPTNFYPSFKRTGDWKTVYDLLLTKKAQKNGLLCGDCGSFLVGLFHNCFDKRLLSKHIKEGYMTKPSTISINKMDIAVFKKNISAYVSKLRFGDMIRVTGHYLLYTGKSGDPAIDYEILEMGGYGGGEYKGQTKAKQNTGTPLDSSGVTAHKSIEKYFERRSGTIIAAWSVLDQL